MASDATLKVYNTTGAEVATLFAGQRISAGEHSIAFDASTLPSGLYLHNMTTPGFTQTRKTVVLT